MDFKMLILIPNSPRKHNMMELLELTLDPKLSTIISGVLEPLLGLTCMSTLLLYNLV